MSATTYKGFRSILEDSTLSWAAALDFLILYPFLRQFIVRASTAVHNTCSKVGFVGEVLGLFFNLFGLVFLFALIWPVVCLGFRFPTFYIAAWIRLFQGVGEHRSRTLNIGLVVFYNIFFFVVYVHYVMPWLGGMFGVGDLHQLLMALGII
ncbi:hypothetical protein AWB71_02548 [Caballeronia peredens]|nr:hypothetical protein AWB71_02548 [Caballeronia peredens]